MNLHKLSDISVDEKVIVAQSGARIIDVSQAALKRDLTGLEFACGIPGSVGGALYMNAGGDGGEMKDVLLKTTVVTRAGELFCIGSYIYCRIRKIRIN